MTGEKTGDLIFRFIIKKIEEPKNNAIDVCLKYKLNVVINMLVK